MSQAQIECTPLIAFINDVQRYYGCADVSLTTLSHLDANLIEGEINRADIVNMYRHNNILRVYRICGWQLKQLMEWSARYFNQWKEGDLTISFEAQIPVYDYAMFGGVLYDINIAQPVGNRIERLRWPDGRSVQMNESLTVAIDDFKAKGFLEKDLFAKDSSVQLIKDFTSGYQGDGRIRNLIIQYIQEHAQGIINNEINSKDNDFRLVGYDWDETLHQEAVRQLNEGIIPISESENSLSYHTQSIRREDLR
nr:5'-nucleotidase C-terminal domain-containing protein [Entomospira entomophilus]